MQLIIPAEAAHDTIFQLGEVRRRTEELCNSGLLSGALPALRGTLVQPCENSLTVGWLWPAAPRFRPRLSNHRSLPQAGLIQFKDLNADKTAFQRTYANQVRLPDALDAAVLSLPGRR